MEIGEDGVTEKTPRCKPMPENFRSFENWQKMCFDVLFVP
jgi:hypothetical protein